MTDMRRITLSGNVPMDGDHVPAPDMAIDANGMHKDYWVLSAEERAKGFVRPVRDAYRHVGRPGPRFPLRELTPSEREEFADLGWTHFEAYPDDGALRGRGRYWHASDLERVGKGCGVVTRMARAIAETYARDPHFYGATFCVGCHHHLPVGADGEFVWDGTNERVGT